MSQAKTQSEALVQKSKPADNKRRNFMIGAGLGGLGAAAALVGGGTLKPAAESKANGAPEPESEGYRETEHIRRYYNSTRL